jgi:hypothetical protein
VLQYWQLHGVMTASRPDVVSGFAAIDPHDVGRMRQAIAGFGNAYVGLDMPLSAQSQDTWDYVATPDGAVGSWGGHAVPLLGYDQDGLVCVTWGALKRMTWRFWLAYADEAWALLSRDFITAAGTTPAGLSWEALAAAMVTLHG